MAIAMTRRSETNEDLSKFFRTIFLKSNISHGYANLSDLTPFLQVFHQYKIICYHPLSLIIC